MNFFTTILFIATGIACIGYIYDFIFLRKARNRRIEEAKKQLGENFTKKDFEKLDSENFLIDQCRSLFWVLLLVMFIRSFLFEPFRIPSASMMPTLLDGDFIAVNKFSYGIKNPFTNKNLIDTWAPERGDVVVFKYPANPNIDFIKRIIGLPGDKIIYRNKHLFIKPSCQNCEIIKVKNTLINNDEFKVKGIAIERLNEQLTADISHDILINPLADSSSQYFVQDGHSGEWVVPEGHYFVMGDNRDNSLDSRFWGFVPFDYLIGKASFIWMSLGYKEDPESWMETHIPNDIRFSRIGGIK